MEGEGIVKPELVTIGVYGYTEEQFFQALADAHVDTFCDIRARRGVRGAHYAFANSVRLQKRLDTMNIRYVYAGEFAPSATLRWHQQQIDKEQHMAKRKRLTLDQEFVHGYKQECLAHLDVARFFERLGVHARVICLCCVEQEPAACHRSLMATKLAQDAGLGVTHLIPTLE